MRLASSYGRENTAKTQDRHHNECNPHASVVFPI